MKQSLTQNSFSVVHMCMTTQESPGLQRALIVLVPKRATAPGALKPSENAASSTCGSHGIHVASESMASDVEGTCMVHCSMPS